MVGEERGLWSDHFAREKKDELLLHCDAAVMDGRDLGATLLRFRYDRVTIGAEEFSWTR